MMVFGILVILGTAADLLLTDFSVVDALAILSGLIFVVTATPPVKKRLSFGNGMQAVLVNLIIASIAFAVLAVPLAFVQGKGSGNRLNSTLQKSVELSEEGNYDEAYELLESFEGYEKTPQILQNMAAVEIMRGNPEQAEELIYEAGLYTNRNADTYYNLGLCSYKQGYFADSIEYFESALRLEPDLWQGYYYEGEAYFAEGNYRGAAYCFQQVINIAPDYPLAYCKLAEVKLKSMDYLEAKELLNAAKKLDISGSLADRISELEESIAFYTDGAAGGRK